MSKVIPIETSGVAIFAMRKLFKVQRVGEPAKGPKAGIEVAAGEVFEDAVLRRFKAVFGIDAAEYMQRLGQRKESAGRHSRAPLSQPDGYSGEPA